MSKHPIGNNAILETATKKEQRLLRRRAASLDTTKSVRSRLLQQGVETDTWLAVANIEGQQDPGIGSGPTGSNLLTATPLSSVYVSTPNISLSTLDISVTSYFLESC